MKSWQNLKRSALLTAHSIKNVEHFVLKRKTGGVMAAVTITPPDATGRQQSASGGREAFTEQPGQSSSQQSCVPGHRHAASA